MGLNSTVENDSLTRRQQLRNVALYAASMGLIYFSAPVVYIGITQASLCKALGASDTVANLPSSARFWAQILPVFVVWRFHTVSAIKPALITCYATVGISGLAVAGVLYWPIPAEWQIAVVVIYGGLIGGALGVSTAFLWELVGRGIGPERRGLAFGLAYGLGPLLAIVGSLVAQLILSGSIEVPIYSTSVGFAIKSLTIQTLKFPLNFALLFGATCPILWLAALLASQYVILPELSAAVRPTLAAALSRVAREMITNRVLLVAVACYLLMHAGFAIINNLALYTPEVLNRPSEDYAGYQNALRFLFKVSAGLLLGWLLVRTHPKMMLLITSGLCLCGALWPLLTPKSWFLICFGLMGAGELYGAYYPNYITCSSRPERVRHNMALVQLLSLATGLSPAAFGMISDYYGLLTSFGVAGGVIALSVVIAAVVLPARPLPAINR